MLMSACQVGNLKTGLAMAQCSETCSSKAIGEESATNVPGYIKLSKEEFDNWKSDAWPEKVGSMLSRLETAAKTKCKTLLESEKSDRWDDCVAKQDACSAKNANGEQFCKASENPTVTLEEPGNTCILKDISHHANKNWMPPTNCLVDYDPVNYGGKVYYHVTIKCDAISGLFKYSSESSRI